MFHGNESRRANLRIAQRQVERSSGQDDMQYPFRLFGERCLASFIRMHFSIDRSRREITKALRQALPVHAGWGARHKARTPFHPNWAATRCRKCGSHDLRRLPRTLRRWPPSSNFLSLEILA